MKTRRQARLDTAADSVSPLKKKNQKTKGTAPDQKQTKKGDDQPKKKVKKQRSPSPKTSAEVQKNKRMQKKKEARLGQESKQKSKEKNKDLPETNNQKNKSPQKKREENKEQVKKLEEKKNEKTTDKSPQIIQPKPKEEQIKKVVVKGAAPVDQYYGSAKDVHVLVYNGKVYSANLNQSNVSSNNNKFYNLQILQSDNDPNKNFFFTRWGRVGANGQNKTEGPYTIQAAIRIYNEKYHQKHKKGDYRQLQLNFGDDEQDKKDAAQDGNDQPTKDSLADLQESKLPRQTKELINLIFDINMMNQQMKQIGYNVKKMPLGKLSKEHIKKGYNILKELYAQLEQSSTSKKVESLTNDFYSNIPHDFGYQKMANFKLDTVQKVKQKLEMLESLSEIKIATEILSKNQDGNQIDNNYKKLNRELEPIEKDSPTYKILDQYLQSTHGGTHRSYALQLVSLFKLHNQNEHKRFTEDIPNKMLLWHGSRLTNYVGILSQGLRIAPPEAPVTGYMFGKGVYFADMSSKSANYCFTTPDRNTGILILCEVAIGNANEKFHADYLASNLPDGKHSTKGMGRTVPSKFVTLDGAIVPMGPSEQSNLPGCSLMYNEFIVYKIEQIRIKYLLRVNFNYSKR